MQATLTRRAEARWTGTVRDGRGTLSTPDSGVLGATRFAFGTRFGGERGTNPEELLAAAHAGCFSMALAFRLGNAGFAPEEIITTAKVTMALTEGHYEIRDIELGLDARVPNIDEASFQAMADDARATCLVSRALRVPVRLTARLETSPASAS